MCVHKAQKVTLEINTNQPITKFKYRRFFSEEAKDIFLARLGDQDWRLVITYRKEKWTSSGILLQQAGIFNEYFPVKQVQGNKNRNVNQNQEVIECKNWLDDILMLKRQNLQDCDLYKITKEEYDNLLIKARSLYFRERVNELNKNKQNYVCDW